MLSRSDGDLMGDGVNIAARLEGIAKPGAKSRGGSIWRSAISAPPNSKNIAEPIRVYSLEVGKPVQARPATEAKPAQPESRSSLAPPWRSPRWPF